VALAFIEAQAANVLAHILASVISIPDGQIVFDTDLVNDGIRLVISVGILVSRVGHRRRSRHSNKSPCQSNSN
jgi:F0F1-type ATP synthase alpha subunit